MEYYVEHLTADPVWENISKLKIGNFCWKTEYQPISYAQLAWKEDDGLHVRMFSYEDHPVSRWTQNDEMVWEDSCMEFFINFSPALSLSYLNYEVNHKGVVLIQYGEQGNNRTFVVPEYGMSYPEIIPFEGIDDVGYFWGIEYTILQSQIVMLYPDFYYHPGVRLKGNFFKCGEKTGRPHYGSWTKIINDTPAFHKPEFFGNIILM